MAGGHEMIGSPGSVPVGIFIGYNAHVIRENTNETVTCVSGDGLVYVIHNVNDAYGQEKDMGLLRIMGRKWAFSTVHLVNEMALN